MYSVRKFIHLLTLTLLTLVLTACSKDEVADPDGRDGGSTAQVYLVVAKPYSAPATRAISTPTPGEDGDGYQYGTENESKVENIYAFFYDANYTVNNASDNLPLVGVYFDENEWESQTQVGTSGDDTSTDHLNRYQQTAKKAVPDLVLGDSYRVITIANCDADLKQTLDGVKTMGDLRSATTNSSHLPWNKSGTTYDNFLMASENDNPVLKFTTESEASKPSTTIDLERVAARVDFNCAGEADNNNPNVFTLTSDNTTKVTITGAALFNVPNAAHTSYLLKRVATPDAITTAVNNKATTPTPVTYLGDEEPASQTASTDPKSAATNYVIDPHTAEKAAQGSNTNLYNASEWRNLYSLYKADYTSAGTFAASTTFVAPPTSTTSSTTDFATIGYAVENVAPKPTTKPDEGYHNDYFDTGIVFRAQYEKWQTLTSANIVYTYNRTQYTASSIATMLTQMLTDTYGTVSFSRWSDVNTFYNTYKDKDPMGYAAYVYKYYTRYHNNYNISNFNGNGGYNSRNYFSYSSYISGAGNSSQGNLYSQLNMSRTNSYDGYTYGLNADKSKSSTYDLLQAMGFVDTDVFTTNEYTTVTGYYTYYIRHADDGDTTNEGIMEHAIVRNNLYQVTVKSISAIPDDPFTKTGIEIVVAVKPWSTLAGETFDF